MVPDLTIISRVILYPRIRKVSLDIYLTVLQPPEYYCNKFNIGTLALQYNSPIRLGRKPLQVGFLVGGLIAGAIMGAIAGGGTFVHQMPLTISFVMFLLSYKFLAQTHMF